MKNLNFQIDCISESLPAVLLDEGDWLFNSGEVCTFAGIVSRKADASRWVKDNLPKKWWLEFKPEGIGRPGTYLSLSGFLYAISMGKSEIALSFRDEVYDNILPNVIMKGGHISKSANLDQLDALQVEIAIQKLEIAKLTQQINVLEAGGV
jgi:prophage antirepressor-like protein